MPERDWEPLARAVGLARESVERWQGRGCPVDGVTFIPTHALSLLVEAALDTLPAHVQPIPPKQVVTEVCHPRPVPVQTEAA